MPQCKTISITNQKGGVGKTTTTLHLGAGLVQAGKRVLLVDGDGQGSLTSALGFGIPDNLPVTLATHMAGIIQDSPINPLEGLLHHPEGMDVMPSNSRLFEVETALVNAMSRETVLAAYLDSVRDRYDYCLVDSMPSLGNITVNILTASDSIIVPVAPEYLTSLGMTQLFNSVGQVRRRLNPGLQIEGVLFTLANMQTNLARSTVQTIREAYGGHVNIFEQHIPRTIKISEASAAGQSIFAYAPEEKAAAAYMELTKEVLQHGEKERAVIHPAKNRGLER